MDFLALPCDIHGYILKFMGPKSICRLMSSCSFLRKRLPPLVETLLFSRTKNSYQHFLRRCLRLKKLVIMGAAPEIESLIELTEVQHFAFFPLPFRRGDQKEVLREWIRHEAKRKRQYIESLYHLLPWIVSQPIRALRFCYRFLPEDGMVSLCAIPTLRCFEGFVPASFTPFLPPSIVRLAILTTEEASVTINHLTALLTLKMTVRDPQIYTQIRGLRRLRILDLWVKKVVPELTQLPITHLQATITSEPEIEIISQIRSLRKLNLTARYVGPSLVRLPITSLRLPDCTGIPDLSFILQMQKLQRLSADKISSQCFQTFLHHPRGDQIICRVCLEHRLIFRGNLKTVYSQLLEHENDQKIIRIPANRIPANRIPANRIPTNGIPANRIPVDDNSEAMPEEPDQDETEDLVETVSPEEVD